MVHHQLSVVQARTNDNHRRRFWHATHDCVAPYVDIILHRGRFWAKSAASGSVSWCCFRSCWTVLSHVMRRRPSCLLQFAGGEAIRILLASALSSMRIICPTRAYYDRVPLNQVLANGHSLRLQTLCTCHGNWVEQSRLTTHCKVSSLGVNVLSISRIHFLTICSVSNRFKWFKTFTDEWYA